MRISDWSSDVCSSDLPPDGFPPDPFAEPQRAGLALPDSGPTPQPTQRIADHDGTDGAWNVEKVMGHRQRGQAPGHGRRLEPPRLAIVNIGDKPPFVGGQADPAAPGREARVAIQTGRAPRRERECQSV